MASFNEGGFEQSKAPVHLSPDIDINNSSKRKKQTGISPDPPTPEQQFDTSTSAFLFDLAIQMNDDDIYFKMAVLERHDHFHIKGIHPHPTYSLRFGTVPDEEGEGAETSRLWAQRHILAREPYYVVSASPFDMDASKKDRSEFYLGKLKESHGARSFIGYSCAKDNTVQKPNVCVIYDHERVAGEKKMEIGIPMPCDSSDPTSDTLEDDFHEVRRNGAQNHPSTISSKPVMFFHQKDDAPEIMSNAEVLQKFVIDEAACATRTSTKNFQLRLSGASRANVLPTIDSSTQGQNQLEVDVSQAVRNDEDVVLQMGKLDDNVFSCAYKAPFTLLQVFMICLSRFETKQAY